MKWIVTLPDGREFEETGGSPEDAASHVANRVIGDAVEHVGEKHTFQVRRKNPPSMFGVKLKEVTLGVGAYWSAYVP